MTSKIIQLLFLTLASFTTTGQVNSGPLTFHKTEEIYQPGHYAVSVRVHLTTVVHFLASDSVKFIFYTTKSSDKHQSITKEVYTGVSRKLGDTAVVQFIYKTNEKKNRFGVVESKIEKLPFDNYYQNCRFVITKNSLSPFNNDWIPVLDACSEDKILEIELKYTSWSGRVLVD